MPKARFVKRKSKKKYYIKSKLKKRRIKPIKRMMMGMKVPALRRMRPALRRMRKRENVKRK